LGFQYLPLYAELFFFIKKDQLNSQDDVKGMSLFYAIDDDDDDDDDVVFVVTIQLFSQLLNRVRMLY
jgi:hypothetical protein